MAVASHSLVRVAPNLYQRGDGVFVAGLSIDGKWTMKMRDARTKTEAKLQLARLRTNPPRSRAAVAAEREQLPTVKTVAAQFLVHFEAMVDSGERSPRTLDHYAWTLRDYILPAWGEWEPSRVGSDRTREQAGYAAAEMNGSPQAASGRATSAIGRNATDFILRSCSFGSWTSGSSASFSPTGPISFPISSTRLKPTSRPRSVLP